MHPNNNNSTNIPAFLIKLWKIVEDPATNELVSWNHNGSSFIIHDPDRFCKELLPQYFKHGNNPTCSSFIRQLNMYGFRKVMNIGKNNDSKEMEFHHSFFLHGNVELLSKIKRKIAPSRDPRGESQRVTVEPETSFGSNDVLTNLSILREKQKNMDITLTKMKQENELLWRELSTVQQRHKKQEQVLHKVIQFLVQIIQRSNQNIHVPKKLARMLQDSSVSQENSSHVARIVDVLRNNDSDCIFVPDESNTSPAGAVIHEVTDFEPDILDSQPISTAKFNTSILKPLKENLDSSASSLKLFPNESASSVGPLNPLERSAASTSKESLPAVSPDSSPGKFITFPVVGDPSQVWLIPADHSTSQQISRFKNVIALPSKESVSNKEGAFNVIPGTNETAQNKSLKKNPRTKLISPQLTKKNFFYLRFPNETPSIQKPKSSSMSVNSEESVKNDSNESVLSCVQFPKETLLAPIPESSSKSLKNKESSENDFDDSVLSDLLQASKISTLEENAEGNSTINDISMDVDSLCTSQSSESVNNEIAIPESSSLVKSKSGCYPDFSVLQDTMGSPSGFDTKLLEQLLCLDDAYSYESKLNPSYNEKDISITNSSDDILGNELVQFNPVTLDDDIEFDQQQWFDFLNQESYTQDSHMSKFCGPQDLDVLLSSTTPNSSNVEMLKNEAALTTSLIPTKKHRNNVKKNKRRKIK